ncbi:autotransporter domain-containing protein [Roseimicrobium gellanilyticum]|nr:autotransporter outer membrane beta-barrel domain-containing protein [Roseimicrobium gellanilyticum]
MSWNKKPAGAGKWWWHCLLLTLGLGSLPAQNTTWVNPSNGSWFVPSNWSPANLPTNGTGDQTFIRNGSTVTVGQSGAVSWTLFLGDGAGTEGTLTISSSGALTTNSVVMGNDSSQGVLNLNGSSGSRGVLSTRFVTEGSGSSSLVMNGGVLRATANESNFLRNFESGDVVLNGGGGFVDTHGFGVGIQAIMSGSGSLTVQGTGTLTITGAQLYTGGTFVDPGATLQVGTDTAAAILEGSDGTSGGAGGTAVTAGQGATVNVSALGIIRGGDGGVSPTLTGNGGIGVHFTGDGSLTNHGDITGGRGLDGPTPQGGAGADGVRFEGIGTVVNTGNIIAGVGGGSSIGLAPGGSGVVLIGGGSVTNQGTIRGQNAQFETEAVGRPITGMGVYLGADGSVINEGDIFAGGGGYDGTNSIQGGAGVHIAGNGMVQNSGLIQGGVAAPNLADLTIGGTGGTGVLIGGVGTVTNSGTINGGTGTIEFGEPLPIPLLPGSNGGTGLEIVGGGTLTNSGTIRGGNGELSLVFPGSGGVAVNLGADGAVTNSGKILGGSGGEASLEELPQGGSGGGALRIDGVGTVINSGVSSEIIGGAAGGGIGQGGHGIELTGGGTLTNEGLVQGGNGSRSILGESIGGNAVLFGAGGTVVNSGRILGGSSATGVQINGLGQVTNNAGAIIQGGDGVAFTYDGVTLGALGGIGLHSVGGGTLVNEGVIEGGTGVASALGSEAIGGDGVRMDAGGTIVNRNIITGGAGGRREPGGAGGGSAGGFGLRVEGAADVTNSGTIQGGEGGSGVLGASGGAGLALAGGGALTNSGTIRAGHSGSGDVFGEVGAAGVYFGGGGSVTNTGDIYAGNGGSVASADFGIESGGAGGDGVRMDGGGVLNNSGTITAGTGGAGPVSAGADGYGVRISGAAGSLVNNSTGIIHGQVSMGDFANSVTLFTGSRINGDLNMSANTGTTLTLDGAGTETLTTAVTGDLTFDGLLVKQGTGRWNLTEATTRTGETRIDAGTLAVGHNTALGSGTVTMANATTLTASSVGDRTLANDLVINGTVTLGTGGGGADMTFNGDVELNGGHRRIQNPGDANDSTGVVNLNGVISNGGITFGMSSGGAEQRAYFHVGGAGSNTYTGDTEVDAATTVFFAKTAGATTIAGNLIIKSDGEAHVDLGEQIADTSNVSIQGTGALYVGDTSDVSETIARLDGEGSVHLSATSTGSALRVGEGEFSGSIQLGVTGSISLEKYGTGILELSGASTYLGNTIVSGGSLIVNNSTGSATGTGTVFVQDGALLGGSGFISGPVIVEGGGTLSAGNSPGTLTLGGLDLKGGSSLDFELGTPSDLIDINGLLTQSVEGTIKLNLSDGPGFAPGTYTLLSFDTLAPSVTLGDFAATQFDYLGMRLELLSNELLLTIFGLPYGPFIQNSAFVFTPVDADFFVSGFVQTGTPAENNTVNSLTFAPGSFLQVYNQLTITSGNFTVNSGRATIAGGTVFVPGEFNKLGAGLFFSNGAFQVVGNSFIRQGSLHVNGAFQTPSLFVLPGAFLGGNGLIIGNVFNSGTVGPGNSVGELTIRGNYNQSRRGTLQIEIAGPGSFDRLVVSGTARLAGTLDVRTLAGAKLKYGQQYPFLQAGMIAGRFDRILMPQPSVNRGRFFDAENHGVLVVAPTSYTLVAQTPNQTRVARALDEWIGIEEGDVGEVTLALDLLQEGQYPQAFESIMPQAYAGALSTAVELSVNHGQQLHQYLSARRLGARSLQHGKGQPIAASGKGVKNPKAVAPSLLAHADEHRWQAWMQGSGLFSEGGLSLAPNEDFESGTFLVGADYAIADSVAVGFFASYQEGWGDYANGAETDLESVRFGLYATYDLAGFYANAAIGGGSTEFDVKRPLQWATLKRTAHGDPDAMEFFTLLGAGYDFQVGNFTFGPQASLQYTRLEVDGFTERGADSLDLRMEDSSEESLRAYLGARFAYTIHLSEQVALIPEVRVFWQHEFLQDGTSLRSRLDSGAGPAFDYLSEDRDEDAIFAGGGIGMQVGPEFYANVYYNAEFGRGDDVNHTISVNATLKF